MRLLPISIIVACIFGISTMAAAAEIEDYSATIKIFENPLSLKSFQ